MVDWRDQKKTNRWACLLKIPEIIVVYGVISCCLKRAFETDCITGLLLHKTRTCTYSLLQAWIPVMARDADTQRRQNSNGCRPLSDAYVSGMPAKRRKVCANDCVRMPRTH